MVFCVVITRRNKLRPPVSSMTLEETPVALRRIALIQPCLVHLLLVRTGKHKS
jgi:hypothetical protein